jgi:Spy/CpxP family protein refolding chaperone
MNKGKIRIGLTATGIIIGLAALVFAYDNYGHGHMMGGSGHMMDWGASTSTGGHNHGDMGYSDDDGDITQEQIDAIKKSQQTFYQETQELRRAIKEKGITIENELQRENPDSTLVISLQTELSQIEAQYDRKAIEYELELRKQLPQSAFNRARGSCCL